MDKIDARQKIFNNAVDKLIAQIPNGLSDIEKARYVYLNLGKLLCYDEKYWYGNSEIKSRIFRKYMSTTPKFSQIQPDKKKKAICVSISKLYSSVLKKIGIKSGQQQELDHTCSYLFIDNKLYYADLNNDLKFIQLDLPTKHFFINGNNVLSKDDLQKIDQKLGYFYTGVKSFKDVIDLIRSKIKIMDNLGSKLQCIFDLGSTIHGVKNLEIIERNLTYKYLLENTLPIKELNRVNSLQLYETQLDEGHRKNRTNYQTIYLAQDFNRDSKINEFFAADDCRKSSATNI